MRNLSLKISHAYERVREKKKVREDLKKVKSTLFKVFLEFIKSNKIFFSMNCMRLETNHQSLIKNHTTIIFEFLTGPSQQLYGFCIKCELPQAFKIFNRLMEIIKNLHSRGLLARERARIASSQQRG